MPPINRLWVCDCGESAWSTVLAVDDWDGQPEPVGPDCPECGGVMEVMETRAGQRTRFATEMEREVGRLNEYIRSGVWPKED